MPNVRHDAHGRFAPNPDKITKQKASFSPYDELGRSYKVQYGAGLFADFLPDLRGGKAVKAYTEMSTNDSTVGAVLFAIEMLLRRMSWDTEPFSDAPNDVEAADFLEECRGDMSQTWADHIAAAVSMLTFGFSFFELVYKQRAPENNSQFSDGRVGWRKFGFRPQETLVRWDKDEHGGVEAFVQQVGNELVTIPIEKGLLYQVKPGVGDPESRSVLRTAYRSWWLKKRIEEITAIGVERNLAGLPVLRIPAEAIIAGDALYTRAKEMAQRLRQDEQMGVVWPSDRWPDSGQPMYEIGTLPTPGQPGVNPVDLIRMYSADIAATVLADFISLGRDATGSRALADPKVEIFTQALGAWADSIEEAINRHAVPRLFALNDFRVDRLPRIKHGPVEKPDLAELGQFVLQVAQAGHDWGFLNEADPIGGQVRQLAGFDPAPEEPTRKRLAVAKWQPSLPL